MSNLIIKLLNIFSFDENTSHFFFCKALINQSNPSYSPSPDKAHVP